MCLSNLAANLRMRLIRLSRANLELECLTDATLEALPAITPDTIKDQPAAANGTIIRYRQPKEDLSSRMHEVLSKTHSSRSGSSEQWIPALRSFAAPAGMTSIMLAARHPSLVLANTAGCMRELESNPPTPRGAQTQTAPA